MDSKQWFSDNQKDILALLNTNIGRVLVGTEDKVVKITPNSVHVLKDFVKNKAVIETRFYCNNYFSILLQPIFDKIEIANEYKKITNRQKALAHYSGLERHKEFPQIYLSTLVVNPATGDGQSASSNGTFSTARSSATGTYYAGRGTFSSHFTQQFECTLSAAVHYIARGFLPIDTSALTAAASISAATLLINVSAYTSNADNQTLGLIETTQAATNTIADTDYDNITLNTPTEFATRIAIASTGNKTWTLNASGLAFINKAGFSKFGFRSSGDIDNAAFASANTFELSYAGSANPPILTITYSLGNNGDFSFL